MLSANIVRKHFPADISPACLDGHSPLLNSLETRADGTPSISQIEALRPIQRCATDAAVIGIAIFGCVVWSRTYEFSSCFFQKFKVMHFQNGDIKLYTVVLLFLCFLKISTTLCCRWSWSRRSTVNNCRVREFQIPDRRAQ